MPRGENYYAGFAPSAQTHPLYRRMSWWWRFYELSYRGGPDYYTPDLPISWTWPIARTATNEAGVQTIAYTYDVRKLQSFLWPFNREEVDDYDQRVIRAFRVNLCRPIVDAFTALVYSKPVRREAPTAPVLAQVWQDVDLTGRDVDAWMAEGVAGAQVTGHMLAVPDLVAERAAPDTAILSRADQIVAGVRPVVYWYSPLEMVDWELDDLGRFMWAQFAEVSDVDRARPAGAASDSPVRYRTYFRNHWEIAGDGTCGVCGAANVGDFGTHPFGKVPVYVLYRRRQPGTMDPVGVAALEDIAPADREIFNLMSQRQSLLYEVNFPFLAVPDPDRTLNRMDISTHRAFGYSPRDGGGPPGYVSPPVDSVRVIDEQIAALLLNVRAVSGLSRGVADQSIAARSGDALMVETQDKAAMVRALAKNAESFERDLWSDVAAAMGQELLPEAIHYPERYDVRSLGDDLDEAERLLKLGPTPAVRAEVLMAVQARMLAHLTAERLAEIQEGTAALAESQPASKSLELTPTDIAAVVTVNQALASVGLPPMAGADGDVTLLQWRAQVEAGVPRKLGASPEPTATTAEPADGT